MTGSQLSCYQCGREIVSLQRDGKWYVYCAGAMGVGEFSLDGVACGDTIEEAFVEHNRREAEFRSVFGEDAE